MRLGRTLKTCMFSSMSLMLVAGGVRAAETPHPCDHLDSSSNLYPTCMEAHVLSERLGDLQRMALASAAKAKISIDEAQVNLDRSVAKYAALGGGLVPGFEAGEIEEHPSSTNAVGVPLSL